MVVGFHLHQNMYRLLVVAVHTGFRIREETPGHTAFDNRRVIFIGRQHAFAVHLEGVADHRKQGFLLALPVDIPGRIENLVAAVLRVGLREHHQFHVGRITLKAGERLHQVVNLVFRQRQAQPGVGFNQGITATGQHRYTAQRARFVVAEQQHGTAGFVEDGLGHAVVQQGGNLFPLLQAQLTAGLHIVGNTTFDTANLAQAAVAGNVRGLTGPGRQRARPGHHKEQNPFRFFNLYTGAVCQQPVQNRVFRVGEVIIEIHKVHELGIHMGYIRNNILDPGVQLAGTERRERGSAAKFKHDINLYRAKSGDV